ncbi:MAG TPA: response regulator transcription factor [Candidatus Binatia bacterium]|nr:response regulator transcription factor [Candidatus Binatia bacterium]
MASKRTVLVVEDEAAIRDGLCDLLAFHGYAPHAVESGDDGLRRALDGDYGLVLLDVMLPGLSGFDVCRALRAERPDQPILMLTARGSEADVVEGLRAGADDYVTKPFSVSELVARVEALLRRAGRGPGVETVPFACGSWLVDPDARRARSGAIEVALSRREVAMLVLLARERGRIVSRRSLLREVWGMSRVDHIHTRTVDVHMAKLRRKLEAAPIETVRGEGYRLAE